MVADGHSGSRARGCPPGWHRCALSDDVLKQAAVPAGIRPRITRRVVPMSIVGDSVGELEGAQRGFLGSPITRPRALRSPSAGGSDPGLGRARQRGLGITVGLAPTGIKTTLPGRLRIRRQPACTVSPSALWHDRSQPMAGSTSRCPGACRRKVLCNPYAATATPVGSAMKPRTVKTFIGQRSAMSRRSTPERLYAAHRAPTIARGRKGSRCDRYPALEIRADLGPSAYRAPRGAHARIQA